MRAPSADSPRVTVRRAPSAGRTFKRPTLFARAVSHTLAAAAPQVRGDVTLLLTSDDAIRHLNRRYRGKDSATDVLAFSLGDGLDAGEPFGDVVVSVDTARRQAREYGASLRDEITRLAVHGTLHLCGYDHHAPREARRMHGLTRKLLKELRAGA